MKIAIVGGGVSGLVCASLLHRAHSVVVFEAGPVVGGHSRTEIVRHEGREIAVDTGFIVFNRRNYPNFCSLVVDRFEVAHHEAPMTFGVRCERTGLEWGGASLNSLYAQRRNLLRPGFHRMMVDILRFGRDAPDAAKRLGDQATLGEYLRAGGYSRFFAEHYLKPMAGAIWSASVASMDDFPLGFLVRFFDNHGMLRLGTRPQWLTITGGSKEYVRRLTAPFRSCLRTASPVLRVRRSHESVEIVMTNGASERFDSVVFACHGDQALSLLADATPAERSVLGAMRYQPNEAVLHTDVTVLPRNRRAWSAWNGFLPAEPERARATGGALVTYNMSLLQGLSTRVPLLVSLNMTERIDPAKVLTTHVYHHPQYSHASLAAQRRWAEISGVGRTHYCGAYWGNGFHEDGVNSAIAVAARLGADAGQAASATGNETRDASLVGGVV